MKQVPLLAGLLIAALFIGQLIHFPTTTANPSILAADLGPALLVKMFPGDTTSVPLGINDIDIDIKVKGNIAITTISLNFYNDQARNLEGEFVFPLAEGQSIYSFALDVDGQMRQGVVVEKEKGRQVFESIERRRVDPGLLEWTQGNNFRARVFPIPSKGYKKIVVGFQQELQVSPQAFIYSLPLTFRNKVKRFTVHAEVNGDKQPNAIGENPYMLVFKPVAASYLAQVEYKNVIPDKALAFEIPYTANATAVYTEKIPGTTDSYYFYALVHPPVATANKAAPANLGVVWDVSSSAKGRNLNKETAILEQYLQKLKNVDVKLLVFSNTTHAVKDFKIAGGNSKSLMSFISSFEPDGGTQLGCLNLAAYKFDECLFFSDGQQTFGSSAIQRPSCPVYCISTASAADFSKLQFISNSTGGRFINAQALSADDALNQITGGGFGYWGANTGGSITQVYPSIPVNCGATFGIAGILKGTNALLEIKFGGSQSTAASIKIKVDADNPASDKIISRIWAQKKIAELDLQYEENKDKITRIGKQFTIVTRNTSLLVLERIEDYVEYGVEPPDDMKIAYQLLMDAKNNTEQAQKENHLQQVINDFKQIADWWDKDFKAIGKKQEKTITGGLNSATSAYDGETDTTAVVMDGGPTDSFYWTSNGSISSGAVMANASSFAVTSQDRNFETTTEGDPNASEHLSVYDVTTATSGTADNGVGGVPEPNKAKLNRASPTGSIKLKDWNPQEAYMVDIKANRMNDLYKTYLDIKPKYTDMPSFYIDVADYLQKNGRHEEALRVISNLAEIDPENHRLLRVLAHRLQQWKENELAVFEFEQVLKIRSEEPQSYRDLGLAYAQTGNTQKGIDMLCKVVDKNWDGRFPAIEAFVACEANYLRNKAGADKSLTIPLNESLKKKMPVDVRVVVNWDADNCDMDLWVTDPKGEKCFYSHTLTEAGGRISRDFTGGYGPEEFELKKALPGKYKVQVNYYGSGQQTLAGPTTVQAELYTNYGRPNEIKKEITLRLANTREVVDIGEFEFVP